MKLINIFEIDLTNCMRVVCNRNVATSEFPALPLKSKKTAPRERRQMKFPGEVFCQFIQAVLQLR